MSKDSPDILVIGAGAAGMMAALAARGVVAKDGTAQPLPDDAPDVLVVNNESRIGMKILISGGGRCNVTNMAVSAHDYLYDDQRPVQGVLREFSADSVQTFFDSRGVSLYAEPLGKVFPESDSARDILDCLLGALKSADVRVLAPREVIGVQPEGSRWRVKFSDGSSIDASSVILATGGKSIPGTGSRGFGYEALANLGHVINPPMPALSPVILEPGPLAEHAGLTLPAILSLVPEGTNSDQLCSPRLKALGRAAGSLLITHDGISGPSGLDISGAVSIALQRNESVFLSADFWTLQQPDGPWMQFLDDDKPPGACLAPNQGVQSPDLPTFQTQAEPLLKPEQSIGRALAARVPRNLLLSLLERGGLDAAMPCRAVDEGRWRQLWLALTQAKLSAKGVAGFNKAEVTHGGLPLNELQGGTLESKKHPGLYVCGEVLNVTGRLGGFNFQWAWSSGFVAGRGALKNAKQP